MPSQFLKCMFKGCLELGLYIELRMIGISNNVRSNFYEDHQTLVEAISEPEEGFNYYFGVHPRSREEGTADAVEFVTCFFADVDYRNFGGDEEAAYQRICQFPLEPSVLVESGHGLHPYWIFESPVFLQDAPNYRVMLKALQEQLGSDPVHDLPRIMRLPGTMNRKDPANPVPCMILEADFTRLYSPSDFKFLLDEELSSRGPDRTEEIILEGERNVTLTSVAGKLRSTGLPTDELLEALLAVNSSRCKPPLPKEEVSRIARSISKYPQSKETTGQRVSQATRLVVLAEKDWDLLFHDQTDRPCAMIKGVVEPVDSQRFKDRLARSLWDAKQTAPSNEALVAAINIVRAKCRFEGPQIELFNRIARRNDYFYYDLGARTSNVVEVGPDRYSIVEPDFPLFQRYGHQMEQVRPVPGGSLDDLRPLVNIQDEEQFVLLKVVLVTALIPNIVHPVLVIFGPQGAAKTSMLRFARALIDPSETPTLTLPRAVPELAQILAHHWLPSFDNITYIHPDVSDALCRAVTGEGFSKRKLYTDQDDVIFRYRRPIALNGINVVAGKPDLLDRSIIIGLNSIDPKERKDEETLWTEFEELRPRLFGAMLDTLSQAMRLRPDIHLSVKPRLADFALWGCAVAESLGIGQRAFLEALDQNLTQQNDQVLSSSPLATVVLSFLEVHGQIKTTPTILLEKLSQRASDEVKRSRYWPKAPHILSARLRELQQNLAQTGVEVSWGRDRERRTITLTKRDSR